MAIARMFSMGMLRAFLPMVLRLYAKHHWTGLELALDQQGSLESCHYLFSRTVKRFLDHFGASAPKTQLRVPLRAILGTVDGGPLPLQDSEAPKESEGAAEAKTADPGAKDKPDDTEWAKVNAVRRSAMRAFWEGRPLWYLVVMRIALEPIRLLFAAKFKTGSWAWEAKQRSKLAKNRVNGVDNAHGRDYRALLAALNVYENEAMTRIQNLFAGPGPWDTLLAPERQAMTVRGRAIAFRFVSRIGAGLEQNLRHRHRQYPFTTLRLPREPELADQVCRDANDETCVGGFCDPWTKSLVADWKDADGLRSPLCVAVLILVLLTVWVCTGFIETLHASTRRLIMAASCHTHQARFDDVNAAWLRGVARRMQGRSLALVGMDRTYKGGPAGGHVRRGRKRKRVIQSDLKPPPKRKRKPFHNPGGPWRFFLRERLWGCKLQTPFKTRMVELAAEYKGLSPHDKARFSECGAAGTRAGRQKASKHASSFGPRGRDVNRQLQRQSRKAMQDTVAQVDDHLNSMGALADLQRQSGSIEGALQVVRMSHSAEANRELDQLHQEALELVRYEEGPGTLVKEQFRAAFPGALQEHIDQNIIAVPTEQGTCVNVSFANEVQTNQVASLAADFNSHYGVDRTPGQLDAAWASTNRALLEKECEVSASPAKHPHKCNDAGMCLCTVDGRQLYSLCESFHTRCTKPIAQPHTQGRTDIKDGMWAFEFIRGAPLAGAVVDAADAVGQPPIILHVATMCLSPWRPTWQVLEQVYETPFAEPPISLERTYTKAAGCLARYNII